MIRFILCTMLLLSQNVFHIEVEAASSSPVVAATDNTPTILRTTELTQLLQAPQQRVVRNRVASYLPSRDSFGLRGASRAFQDVQYSTWAINDPKNEILYQAVSEGDTEKVNLFLKIGANVNATIGNRQTALYTASENGRVGVVTRLIAAGADPNQIGNEVEGFFPLWIASRNGHAEVVQILLGAGADVDQATNRRTTPLYIASECGHAGVVAKLIEKGANVNQVNEDGDTPLSIASANGNEGVVEKLIAAGADVNLADKHGETPLMIASQNGHERVVRLLIDHGANVSQAFEDGYTPLYIASQYGHAAVIQLLEAASHAGVIQLLEAASVIAKAGEDGP